MASKTGSLLGRTDEWSRLADALDQVRGGSFRVVFVHGEAGIGKTRLIQELIAHAEAAGFAVFSGRAEDLERMRPFGAIADGMARFARTLGSEGEALQSFVKELSIAANTIKVIDRFVELVEELAVAQPTCVVLEDLHWADPETITAARALNRRLGYLPILFTGTYRPHPQPSELGRFVDAAVGEGAATIELGRLDDDEVTELVGGIVGGTVGPRLAKMLDAVSGNPLYAAELAHALQEEGVLQFDNGTADAATAELPPTLRLTILRRLSQFPSDVLELLKQAAVLGSTFHLHELAAVSAQPVSDVGRRLEGPIAAKIIEERDNRLAFRHDLIHEAIYQDIPTPIRASMHVDTARVLRGQGVPAVRIAEHIIRGLDGGDPALFDEVIPLMMEIRLPAPLVALALGEKAIELPGVPEQRRDEVRRYMVWPLVMTGRRDDAIRLGKEVLRSPQDPMIEVEIRWILAMTHAEDGRVRDFRAEMEALIRDTSDYGDPQRHASMPNPGGFSRLLRMTLPAGLLRAGVFDGVPQFEPLLAEAREANDPLAVVLATACLASELVSQGHVAEAVRQAEQYIQMEGPLRSMVPTPYVVPGFAYLAADRFTDARRACQDGHRHASEVGEQTSLAVYGPLESLVCLLGGAWDEAAAEARSALELVAQGIGPYVSVVMAHASLAQIALRRGNIDEALLNIADAERVLAERGPQWASDVFAWTKALCIETSDGTTKALEAFRAGWEATAGGHYLFGRPAFPDLIRIAVATGERDLAAQVAEEAEEGRRRAEEVPSVVGAALRCRGLLDDEAELLVAAVDAYRKSPRVLEKAGACEDAARSLARRGKATDARALFEEALTTFDELGAAHDSSRVLADMRSAGIRRGSRAPRRRAVTGWDALTPSEVEVARLTVEGLTNPKIAERLYVSKYTVQTHLSHIFNKLQVSSRSELAAMAATHQDPA